MWLVLQPLQKQPRFLLSSRHRRHASTARVSFCRYRGDTHPQHLSPFVDTDDTRVYNARLLS
jgi:hypothetical protein